MPVEIFIDHIDTLHRRGYRALTLYELYEYVLSGRAVPERSVVLTLDDGYLDNWVYAFPVLKKYGFKATIFASPEFVDPLPHCRPTLEDVWNGRVERQHLTSFGFLSWEEMRSMQQSGLIDIQSHCMTHTWHFSSCDIVDFRHPRDQYIWMDWNEDTGNKHRYLNVDYTPPPMHGAPVYHYCKALEGKRFIPPGQLKDFLQEYVQRAGGLEFFNQPHWKSILYQEAKAFTRRYRLDQRLETDDEFEARLNYEILHSKTIIERMLDKPVDFLCWPGGGICDRAMNFASQVYKSVTLPSRLRIQKYNMHGESPSFFKRIGAPHLNTTPISYLEGDYLHHLLREFQGSVLHRRLRQFHKGFNLAKLFFFRNSGRPS